MTKHFTMAIMALALLLTLGACGRKGDLEPPPSTPAHATSASQGDCSSVGDRSAAPIDATAGGAQSGNPNRMPDTGLPPC